MTFAEYMRIPEGLWLNDKNALPGMSRLNPLPAHLKRRKPVAMSPKVTLPKLPKASWQNQLGKK